MSKTDKQNGLISGFIIGTAVGTIAGLFLTTRPGQKTRVIVQKSVDALPELAEDFVTTAQQHGVKWSHLAQIKLQKSLTRVQKAIAVGIEASKLAENPVQSPLDDNPESSQVN